MKPLLLIFATVCYGSAAWGAFSYFRVEDEGARFGKRIISVLGGLATATCLGLILAEDQIAPGQAIAALALYVLAIALFWWAYLAAASTRLDFLGSSRAPAVVLGSGPYTRIRHPFYWSDIMGWLAAFIAVPGLITALLLLVLATAYVTAALREERAFSTSALSGEYAEYQQRTKRFIPGLF